MQILIILIGIIVFFVVALFLWNAYQKKRGNTDREDAVAAAPRDGTCCGNHATCEKDSLINSFEEEIDYFDDEELDRFKTKTAENYTNNEVNEFREVFDTLLDQDKARWVRSLEKRAIAIPNELRDEIILIINDLRIHKTKHA